MAGPPAGRVHFLLLSGQMNRTKEPSTKKKKRNSSIHSSQHNAKLLSFGVVLLFNLALCSFLIHPPARSLVYSPE